MPIKRAAVGCETVAPWRRWLGYFLALVAIASALTLLFWPGTQVHIPLQSEKIALETPDAFAFFYPLGRSAEVGDDDNARWRSDLVLLEDGKPLLPAHTSFEETRKLGRGRYCHWGRNLLFSSSDNTDPRSNGRSYEAVAFLYPRAVYYLGFGPLAASLVILLGVSRRLFLRVYFLAPPLLVLAGSAIFLAVACLGWFQGFAPALAAIFALLPCPRQLLRLEAMAPALLLGWAVGGAWIGWIVWLGRRRFPVAPVRQEEARLRRLLRRFGLVLTIGVFLLTLAARWSNLERPAPGNDATFYSNLAGHLPWSDANGYYWGAQEAAHTGQINDWNERRPVNAALFGLRLAACRFDLDAAMLVQVVLAAAAVYFAAWSIGQRWGVWPGAACVALLLGYARLYLVTTLSEPLGLTLGALAVGLILQALYRRNWLLCAAGLLALALAMSARAGALFLLPCLLVWVFLCFRDSWRTRLKALAAGCLALAVGMSSSFLLDRAYGVGKGAAGANLAHTLCGLSCGTTWSGAWAIYADELKNIPDERAQSRFLYTKAWERFQANPSVFFGALWQGETAFFAQCPAFLKETVAARLVSGSQAARSLDSFILFSIALGAVVWLWRARFQDDFWLVAAAACGVLLSVPFIFLDGGWRVLAASWPLMIVPLAAALAVPGRRMARASATAVWHCRVAVGALVVLVVCIAAGPALARRMASQPAMLQSADAADGSRFVIRAWPGFAAVAVVDEGQPRISGVPTITRRQFIESVCRGNMEDRASLLEPDAPPSPFLIVATYDFAARRTVDLIAPLKMKDAAGPFLEVEVRRWRKSEFFWEAVAFRAVEGAGE